MKLYNRHGSERFCCSATGERAAVGGTDAVKQNQTVARQGRRGGEVSHQRCQDAAEASAMTPKPQQKLQQLRKRSSRSSPSSSSSFASLSSASAITFIKPIRNLRLVPLSVVLLLIISILCGSASATTLSGVRRDRQRSAEIDRLARRGGLLVDRSEPPKVGMGLFRRENVHHPSSSSSTTSSSLTSSASSSVTSSPSPSSASNSTHHPSSTQSAASSTTTADTSQSTSIPTPFDTNLASNFTTTSCPAFFNKFLSNAQFQSCHPLSLLLQNSNSFFDASKSFVRITQTLDATCNVDFKQCLSLMQQYSTDIIDTSNCGTDYKIGNAMVTQAYNGFLAYQPLYEAGCLRDSQGNYCFADAITNKTSATDSYPYYLALGSDLPASSRPTCNSCLQNTMAVFNSFAGNSNQPVSKTYVNAAQQIDISCGPTFANTTVIPSRGANLQAAPYNLFLGLLATAIVFFF